MNQDVECKISANILLAAALRLFSYDKVPLALVLIETILDQHKNHPRAMMMYQVFTGEAPEYPMNRLHRLYYDSETRMFIVGDKSSKGGNLSFKTLEDAEKYLRELR